MDISESPVTTRFTIKDKMFYETVVSD